MVVVIGWVIIPKQPAPSNTPTVTVSAPLESADGVAIAERRAVALGLVTGAQGLYGPVDRPSIVPPKALNKEEVRCVSIWNLGKSACCAKAPSAAVGHYRSQPMGSTCSA